MGIKRNIEIAAEILAVKPSRIAANAAMQQALDLLRQDEQATTRKVKRGKQALSGRVRVERSSRWDTAEIETNELDEAVAHWGVVCHTRDGEWYVTTGAEEGEGRLDLNSVQVLHRTDRVIGVMGFWSRDCRFARLGMAHRDWEAVETRIILGYSSDKEYYFYRK